MTQKQSTPSKLDSAQNRARNHDAARAEGSPVPAETTKAMVPSQSTAVTEMPPPSGVELMIEDLDLSKWGDLEEGWVAAPQLVTLEPGKVWHGFLEGNGPDAEFTEHDPRTKDVYTTTVTTWILRSLHTGVRVSFLGSTQLNKKLVEHIGGEVKICRGPDMPRKSGAGVYTEYLVKGAAAARKVAK